MKLIPKRQGFEELLAYANVHLAHTVVREEVKLEVTLPGRAKQHVCIVYHRCPRALDATSHHHRFRGSAAPAREQCHPVVVLLEVLVIFVMVVVQVEVVMLVVVTVAAKGGERNRRRQDAGLQPNERPHRRRQTFERVATRQRYRVV
uniref:Uncharacterized protein n=1 Tax=Anopheles atroparvus TaxID=41427 RepID=A0A182IN53_ANOAO